MKRRPTPPGEQEKASAFKIDKTGWVVDLSLTQAVAMMRRRFLNFSLPPKVKPPKKKK